MPCRCAGYRVNKCECKVFGGHSCAGDGTSRYVSLASTNTMSDLITTAGTARTNIFIKTIESIYEKCAGYNLRYCPMRGSRKSNSYLFNALKDLALLACFLVANFVVLLTILTKMSVDLYCIVHHTITWIKKQLTKTQILPEETNIQGHPQIPHDFSPKVK